MMSNKKEFCPACGGVLGILMFDHDGHQMKTYICTRCNRDYSERRYHELTAQDSDSLNDENTGGEL